MPFEPLKLHGIEVKLTARPTPHSSGPHPKNIDSKIDPERPTASIHMSILITTLRNNKISPTDGLYIVNSQAARFERFLFSASRLSITC